MEDCFLFYKSQFEKKRVQDCWVEEATPKHPNYHLILLILSWWYWRMWYFMWWYFEYTKADKFLE